MKKFILGTLAGTVTYFILGFLVYGVLLMDMMNELNNPDVMRAEEDMIWWSMILSNVFFAATFAYIFLKYTNISSFGGGASAGAIITLLFTVSVDLSLYAYSNILNGMTTIIVDAVAALVMGGITGGVIGLVIGMGSDKSEE